MGTSTTPSKRYVHGDQVDEPWVQYTGSTLAASARVYLHTDHLGSIVAHSDSSGAVTLMLKYDAYGIPGAANEGRFAYTGQTWLKEVGLFHYKARVYSPKIGRFLQTDPIFYRDELNLYAYVGNDPLNKTDPTGREIYLQSHSAWTIGNQAERHRARVGSRFRGDIDCVTK